MEEFYDYLSSALDHIVELLSDIGITKILDFILDGFFTFFSIILDFVTDFVFGTLWDKTQSYGNYIISFFYNKFASSTISFNFLAYFVGFIFLMFVFKRVLSLIR